MISFGDVRDNLNGGTEVIAAPLLGNHVGVDSAGGEIVALGHARAHEAFVVTEIKIGFSAVFGDEDFAMLKRAHRARVNVDVGVEFEQRHPQAARLENRAERCSSNAFTE